MAYVFAVERAVRYVTFKRVMTALKYISRRVLGSVFSLDLAGKRYIVLNTIEAATDLLGTIDSHPSEYPRRL